MKKILITLSALFLTSLSFAETIQCRVVGVNDGDTITCLADNKQQIKVRLWGIDAPENGQDFEQKSKQALSDMIFGRHVTIETKGTDRYKRTVGVIQYVAWNTCDDAMNKQRRIEPTLTWECAPVDVNINLEMVKQGMAWWYKDYAKKSRDFLLAEREARENKVGLWSQPNPTPPWEWRKQKKAKHK